jgi:hypothetical protein
MKLVAFGHPLRYKSITHKQEWLRWVTRVLLQLWRSFFLKTQTTGGKSISAMRLQLTKIMW